MMEINNLTAITIDKKFLKKIHQKVLRQEKQKDKNLSVALVGRKKIKELNKRYRKKNRPTDVLAFSDKEMGLGEIIICPQEVKKNAKKFGFSFKVELARVLIHGILHLLGYNHGRSKKQAEIMEKKQNQILESLKI